MYYSREAQMNHEQFPTQMTQNSKHNKWLEMLAGKDFTPKLLWRTPTKIHWERKRQRQQKAAKQRDNRLAQRRQRRHTATTNMHRGSDKILQLHCNWSQWREGTPTADASKSDKEIKQRLHFYETYLLRCNDRQQQLYDLYNARQEYLFNGLRTAYQPWQ